MNSTSRTNGSAFTRSGDAWSEVTELGATSFRVRLGGPFRGAWLANLSCRLAEQQISIDHLHARLTGDDIWISELHLLAPAPGAATTDPLALDYIAHATATDHRPHPVFVVDTYRVLESRDYGGSLMLTLEAPDSLGLLGSLLSSLSVLGLVPIELHIETKDGRAFDSLWLRATAGESPTSDERAALIDVLERSCNIT